MATNYFTNQQGKGKSDSTRINQSGKAGGGYGYDDFSSKGNETRIPGMNRGSDAEQSDMKESIGGKPVVGFLISVSRTEEGEYWVLRQGQNTIGSGSNCNIVLSEESVSGMHATLSVQKIPKEGNKLSVGIIDAASANGTFVNGNYIGFYPHECANFDKIKIGEYELLLLLFDASEHDMKKSETFSERRNGFNYSDENAYSSYNEGGTRI